MGIDIPIDANIWLKFSEAMNFRAVESAFSIFPSVSGLFLWNNRNEVIFNPDTELNFGMEYIVTVSTEAEDLTGNNLNAKYFWQFSIQDERKFSENIGKIIITHPNPYITGKSSEEKITFANLPQAATIRIYTVSGELIKTIKHKAVAEGGSEEWEVSGVNSGIYLYTVISSERTQKGKMSIIK